MYVVIDQTTYSALRDLSYAPQTDVMGSEVPINEFSVKVITDDDIAFGQYAELYNDVDTLFAKYWIVYAEREGDAVQIVGRSDIALLDGVTLPAVMYSAEPIDDVLQAVMVRQSGTPGVVGTIDYTLDSALNSVTITGFCPEQTARERLQWVCFVAGAHIRTAFNDEIHIQPIDSTEALVPIDRSFWRPSVKYSDHVTAVKVTAFSFAQGTPQATDEWVQAGSTYYIVTRQDYTLANTEAPENAPDNVISVDSVYLVNSTNVSGILSYLATLYFKRAEVTLDIINNGEYVPGDRLVVYADRQTMFAGYAKTMAFSFGKQSKASVKLVAADTVTGAALVVTYKWGNTRLGKRTYYFPVGYSYSIENLYLDKTFNGHRYIFRPTIATITGTMSSGGNTATVNYEVALDYNISTRVLQIINVDEITTVTESGEVVGVIA